MLGPIIPEEYMHAKQCLIKSVQVTIFSKEIKTLKNKKRVKDSYVNNLNPFLGDNRLIRVSEQMNHSCLPYDQKYSILIHRGNKLDTLFNNLSPFLSKNLTCWCANLTSMCETRVLAIEQQK